MIKSIEQINEIRNKIHADMLIRQDPKAVPTKEGGRMHIMVCGGTGCTSSDSMLIKDELENMITQDGMSEEVKVVKTGCFGLCAQGPIIMMYPDHVMYTNVNSEDVDEIFESHVKKGEPVKRLMAGKEDGEEIENALENVDFFSRQMRVALRNCGAIDPENIDEYIARDGYKALEKVLTEMEPGEVIDVITNSGLRGRGGAGFPTGVKWSFAASQPVHQKYVCCNADEGDPGAFMDRSVLEGDPHSLIEAMAIAAYAIGANQGYVYVRAEYPIAVQRLSIAIDQAQKYGLLGEDILMEAALRTAADELTDSSLDNIEYEDIRGLEGIKVTEIDIANVHIRAACAHGLGNARKLLEKVRSGEEKFDFIEVMACPGGCVNGGGQPIQLSSVRSWRNVREERAQALYKEDRSSYIRKSHNNPSIKRLYKDYLGMAGGSRAHELLHTHYEKRGNYVEK